MMSSGWLGGPAVCVSRGRAVPIWMWPHVLSVDVAAVFAAWTVMFARSFGVSLHLGNVLVGAICVWSIYLSDHLLDGRGARLPATERHQFAHRHRHTLVTIEFFAIGLGWAGAFWLPRVIFVAGLGFMGAVLLYFGVVHAGSERLCRLWPKELIVAGIFAGACSMPAWAQFGFAPLVLVSTGLLFALCVLNGTGLECLEWAAGPNPASRPHPSTLWIGSHPRAYGLGLAALCVLGLFLPRIRAIAASVALSSLLLAAVFSAREGWAAERLRAAGDLVLLTPCFVLLFFH